MRNKDAETVEKYTPEFANIGNPFHCRMPLSQIVEKNLKFGSCLDAQSTPE